MKTESKLAQKIIEDIRIEILDSNGREVMCVGRFDESGLIEQIITAARGNEKAVPALMKFMTRGDVVIHNHPSGNLNPSDADLRVASLLGNQGIGFYIINNQVSEVYVVAEPIKVQKIKKLNSNKLAALIDEDGQLGNFIDRYEKRDSQIKMIKLIVKAFNENKIGIAEAGTGVGKSIAYLIPALKWAMENDERIVISTATINLQNQVMEKDIPLVKKLLKTNLKTVLIKGRNNYICLRRLDQSLDEMSLFKDENDNLQKIKEWSENTKIGSRDDLGFYPENQLWSMVCAESDSCLGLRCKNREKCFVLKLKKEAASSKLLVVNHHLLFSDLAVRMSGIGYDASAVLPPFAKIVFDEAHNIEKSATSFFSLSVSRPAIKRQLNRLYRKRGKSTLGLLISIQKLSQNNEHYITIPNVVFQIEQQIQAIDIVILSHITNFETISMNDDKPRIAYDVINEPLIELKMRIISLIKIIKDILDGFNDEDYENPSVYETRMVIRRLEEFVGFCDKFVNLEDKQTNIYWIEKVKTFSGDFFARLFITPVSLSEVLLNSVYKPYSSIIMTSATLTINKQFNYWMTRIGLTGLNDEKIISQVFPSPFPYKKNTLICVPTDIPFPDHESYIDEISNIVIESLKITEGKGLVLFTSYNMLNQVYENTGNDLSKFGLTVLKQGQDDRTKLFERFNKDKSSVLFATESFWEGVDSPGDTLEIVVICKLPFRVPSDPIIKERGKAVERNGGNSFYDYSLPEAVIKLKQGFGRLIRRITDRGVVLILDNRIVKKHYGKVFFSTLPETMQSLKDTKVVLNDIESFFYN